MNCYRYLQSVLRLHVKVILTSLFLLSGLIAFSTHAATANLSISADNANEVYLNGVLLGTGNDWTQAGNYSVAVQSGANVLAVKGIDTGGIAGLIAELSWPGGSAISNASWKVSTIAEAGWETVAFNDSAWPTATSYGAYGIGPWAKSITGFPANSTAQWIWSADANNDNTVYLRYTFTVVGTANVAPTISLTSPSNNSSVSAPANLTLNANAADSDGTISKVEFYNGATLLNTDTTAPYSYSLNAIAGSYTLSAKATDNLGASTTSAVVNVTVNAATATLSISADNANEVYLNGVLLGTGNDWTRASNYSLAVQSGANVLAVKGIDAGGVAGLIAELSWPGGSAISNASWKVSTTAPAGWETVAFNDSAWPTATSYGAYGIGPWAKNITGFPANSTAQWIWSADANNDNTVYLRYTFSVAAVNPAPTANSIYYVFADHLNTPRVITDTSNKTVWRWDADPFGTDVASEDPDGDGRKFTYNHRFPGQYFDKETALHYNYLRDGYDSSIGRYVQSDPIGLAGGINTYAYVGGNPISLVDPLGLAPAAAVAGGSSGLGVGGVVGSSTGSSNSKTPSYGIIPGFNDQQPSAANNAFAQSVNQIVNAVKEFCTPGGKDPCKGLRDQLREHERKLGEYTINPMAADNKGFLGGALAKNNIDLFSKIYLARIANLQAQIANFKKLLEECERKNGP